MLHNDVALLKSMATFYRNTLMLIGYARVSKLDQQDTRAQVKALKEAWSGSEPDSVCWQHVSAGELAGGHPSSQQINKPRLLEW